MKPNRLFFEWRRCLIHFRRKFCSADTKVVRTLNLGFGNVSQFVTHQTVGLRSIYYFSLVLHVRKVVGGLAYDGRRSPVVKTDRSTCLSAIHGHVWRKPFSHVPRSPISTKNVYGKQSPLSVWWLLLTPLRMGLRELSLRVLSVLWKNALASYGNVTPYKRNSLTAHEKRFRPKTQAATVFP